jgi:hypothetical protein
MSIQLLVLVLELRKKVWGICIVDETSADEINSTSSANKNILGGIISVPIDGAKDPLINSFPSTDIAISSLNDLIVKFKLYIQAS